MAQNQQKLYGALQVMGKDGNPHPSMKPVPLFIHTQFSTEQRLLTIGNAVHCDVIIKREGIAPEHAVFMLENNKVLLYDRSGDPKEYAKILVNSQQFVNPHICSVGDKINIGTRIFEFRQHKVKSGVSQTSSEVSSQDSTARAVNADSDHSRKQELTSDTSVHHHEEPSSSSHMDEKKDEDEDKMEEDLPNTEKEEPKQKQKDINQLKKEDEEKSKQIKPKNEESISDDQKEEDEEIILDDSSPVKKVSKKKSPSKKTKKKVEKKPSSDEEQSEDTYKSTKKETKTKKPKVSKKVTSDEEIPVEKKSAKKQTKKNTRKKVKEEEEDDENEEVDIGDYDTVALQERIKKRSRSDVSSDSESEKKVEDNKKFKISFNKSSKQRVLKAIPEQDRCGACRADYGDPSAAMVQCDNCQVWFHFECVGITEDEANKKSKWFCSKCAPAVATKPTKATPKKRQPWKSKKADEEEEEEEIKPAAIFNSYEARRNRQKIKEQKEYMKVVTNPETLLLAPRPRIQTPVKTRAPISKKRKTKKEKEEDAKENDSDKEETKEQPQESSSEDEGVTKQKKGIRA